jgi:hypothetical protein
MYYYPPIETYGIPLPRELLLYIHDIIREDTKARAEKLRIKQNPVELFEICWISPSSHMFKFNDYMMVVTTENGYSNYTEHHIGGTVVRSWFIKTEQVDGEMIHAFGIDRTFY